MWARFLLTLGRLQEDTLDSVTKIWSGGAMEPCLVPVLMQHARRP